MVLLEVRNGEGVWFRPTLTLRPTPPPILLHALQQRNNAPQARLEADRAGNKGGGDKGKKTPKWMTEISSLISRR